jgi:hypothetical protein
MQEHGCHDGDPVMVGNNVGGDRRPLEYERITTAQFKYKNEEVRENEADRDDGKMYRPSRCVG